MYNNSSAGGLTSWSWRPASRIFSCSLIDICITHLIYDFLRTIKIVCWFAGWFCIFDNWQIIGFACQFGWHAILDLWYESICIFRIFRVPIFKCQFLIFYKTLLILNNAAYEDWRTRRTARRYSRANTCTIIIEQSLYSWCMLIFA